MTSAPGSQDGKAAAYPLPFKAPPARPKLHGQVPVAAADVGAPLASADVTDLDNLLLQPPPAKRPRGNEGYAADGAGSQKPTGQLIAKSSFVSPPGLSADPMHHMPGDGLSPGPPKMSQYPGVDGTALEGNAHATRAGVLAPKQPGYIMGGIQCKSGGPKLTLIPAKGVTVPPPHHLLTQRQNQEDEWRREAEEERRAWEDECKRREEEEKARLQEELDREELRKQEAEAIALGLHAELAPLVDSAEARVARCKDLTDSMDIKLGKSDDEVIKIAEEFEAAAVVARGAIKACSDFMAGKYLKLQGVQESTRQEATTFLKRFKGAEREIEVVVCKVRSRKREAFVSREKEQKRQAALRAAAKQESLFRTYDKDGDGVLSAREVGAFVKGECNFDLPQEKVEGILTSEAFAGSRGVPREKFAQLRLLVGVAAVVGALSGMEAEVAKAEEKAKPLAITRGRPTLPPDMLEERTDEVDAAVDAARDYLAAAREQVQGLDTEQAQHGALAPTAVRMAIQEARKLGTRLDWFEQRLARAAAASKASRDRLVLQQKKEALMRQAELAAARAI